MLLLNDKVRHTLGSGCTSGSDRAISLVAPSLRDRGRRSLLHFLTLSMITSHLRGLLESSAAWHDISRVTVRPQAVEESFKLSV